MVGWIFSMSEILVCQLRLLHGWSKATSRLLNVQYLSFLTVPVLVDRRSIWKHHGDTLLTTDIFLIATAQCRTLELLTLAMKFTEVKVTSLPPIFSKRTGHTAHVLRAICESMCSFLKKKNINEFHIHFHWQLSIAKPDSRSWCAFFTLQCKHSDHGLMIRLYIVMMKRLFWYPFVTCTTLTTQTWFASPYLHFSWLCCHQLGDAWQWKVKTVFKIQCVHAKVKCPLAFIS